MTTPIAVSVLIAESRSSKSIGELIGDAQARYSSCRFVWDLTDRTHVTDKVRLRAGSSIVCSSTVKPVISLVEQGRFLLDSDAMLCGVEIENNVAPRPDDPPSDSFSIRINGEDVKLSELHLSGISNYGIIAVDSSGLSLDQCRVEGFGIAGLTIRDSAFSVSGVVSRNCGHGIHILGSQGELSDSFAENNKRHGFAFVHCPNPVVVERCTSIGNSGNGFVFGGSKRERPSNYGWRIAGCEAKGNGGNGFSIDPTLAGKEEAVTQNGVLERCLSMGNQKHGLYVTHAHGVVATECVLSDNGIAGIAISKSRDVTVNMSETRGNRKAEIAFYGTSVENTGNYVIARHTSRLEEGDVFYKSKPPLGFFVGEW